MKNVYLYFILSILIIAHSAPADAQRWKLLRYEVIGGIGSTNIFGDIGGAATRKNWLGLKDLRITATRPSLEFGFRYKRNPNTSYKLNLIYGYGVGNDAGAVNDVRNFSFSTNIIEQSLVYEHYFIPEERKVGSAAMYNRRGMLNNYSHLSFYGFAGLGGLFVNAHLTGMEHSTRQSTVYKNGYSLVLPLGVGVKYVIDEHWLAGAEIGGRYALYDGIDGYSSIYSHSNDIYYFFNVNVNYKLKTDRKGFPAFLGGLFSRISENQKFNSRGR